MGFEITRRSEVFADAPQFSNATKFGTKGFNFRARKPAIEAVVDAAFAAIVRDAGPSS